MSLIDCDLVLVPRISRTWILFDRYIFVEGKEYAHKRASTWLINYGKKDSFGNIKFGQSNAQWPSFQYSHALEYILANDKKQFRKNTLFCDYDLKPSYFQNVKCSNGTICKIVNVSAVQNLFICPSSGIVWQYPDNTSDWDNMKGKFNFSLSSKIWKFKSLPESNRVFNNVLYNNHITEEIIKYNYSESAFLSSESVKLWEKFCKKNFTDCRSFLYETHKVSKHSVIKSAARYIKKISRVAPLSEATKKFFKTLGALAHIKKAATYATQT